MEEDTAYIVRDIYLSPTFYMCELMNKLCALVYQRAMFKGCFLGNYPRMIACLLDIGICHIKEISSDKRAKKLMKRFSFVGSHFDFFRKKTPLTHHFDFCINPWVFVDMLV